MRNLNDLAARLRYRKAPMTADELRERIRLSFEKKWMNGLKMTDRQKSQYEWLFKKILQAVVNHEYPDGDGTTKDL